MRVWILVAMLAGCGSDEPPPVTCKPDGPYIIPPVPDCEVADCRGVNCDTTCASGTTCGSTQCRLDCQPAATCTFIDCTGADVCFIDCHGAGSTCEVACEDAGQCDVSCNDGAACVLDCGATPSATCRFGRCVGGSGILDCGNGVTVCNRSCP